jgi:hypothetical protein
VANIKLLVIAEYEGRWPLVTDVTSKPFPGLSRWCFSPWERLDLAETQLHSKQRLSQKIWKYEAFILHMLLPML